MFAIRCVTCRSPVGLRAVRSVQPRTGVCPVRDMPLNQEGVTLPEACRPSRRVTRCQLLVQRSVTASVVSLLGCVSAAAAAPGPTVAPGFTITKLAAPPKDTKNCDDLTFLDGHLFVTCQNATQSPGGGGNSTILEYAA